jgi:hypothetical protein
MTILFGGFVRAPLPYEKYYNDTWIYDLGANTWGELVLDTVPSSRASHAMVFDSVLGAVWLFGGYNSSIQVDSDTWVYGNPAVIPEFPNILILSPLMIATMLAVVARAYYEILHKRTTKRRKLVN